MGFDHDKIKDPRLRARILAILAGGAPLGGQASVKPGMPGPSIEPPRPLCASTDEAKLNKTERAFLSYLRLRQTANISIQAITLKLADDCRYTPDFFSVEGGLPTFWEVKGFWRDDARVKIKVAARLFLWAHFVAVQRIKGEWKYEEIKP